jgi:hypothetical protein
MPDLVRRRVAVIATTGAAGQRDRYRGDRVADRSAFGLGHRWSCRVHRRAAAAPQQPDPLAGQGGESCGPKAACRTAKRSEEGRAGDRNSTAEIEAELRGRM